MSKQTKTLTLLFLQKDGQVLLAMKKRGFGAGRWNGTGGKVEPGETVEQAMIRETQEEIGVTPTTYRKVGEIRFDEFMKDEPTIMHSHIYIATEWQGEPHESEEMNPKWFDISEIPYDTMWPDDIFWLPQVLEGKTIEAEFTLDQNDTILSRNVHSGE